MILEAISPYGCDLLVQSCTGSYLGCGMWGQCIDSIGEYIIHYDKSTVKVECILSVLLTFR